MPNIIQRDVFDLLRGKQFAKVFLQDIFKHCNFIDFDGETQSVEYIMKYPKTFPERIVNVALEEYKKAEGKMFFSLEYDIEDYLFNGGWEKE